MALLLFEWAVLRGVWTAASFKECGEIVARIHGPGPKGACWAVFNGRISEFLFGPHPPEFIWRHVSACVLIIAALAPLIFGALPRKLLWLSVACPFIALILITGGVSPEASRSFQVGGIFMILVIAATSATIAISSGTLLAIGHKYAAAPVRVTCAAITAFCRGTPLVVLLFISTII